MEFEAVDEIGRPFEIIDCENEVTLEAEAEEGITLDSCMSDIVSDALDVAEVEIDPCVLPVNVTKCEALSVSFWRKLEGDRSVDFEEVDELLVTVPEELEAPLVNEVDRIVPEATVLPESDTLGVVTDDVDSVKLDWLVTITVGDCNVVS